MSTKRRIPKRYRDITSASPISKRLDLLGHLLRTGQATPEETAEYERLDTQEAEQQAAKQATREPIKSIWDLPIARKLWEADMRDTGCP